LKNMILILYAPAPGLLRGALPELNRALTFNKPDTVLITASRSTVTEAHSHLVLVASSGALITSADPNVVKLPLV
jgi:hypothetical protein